MQAAATIVKLLPSNNMLGKYEESYKSALACLKIIEQLGLSPNGGWENFGYSFWMAGHKDEGMKYFKKQIELYKEILKLDPNDPNTSSSLAGIYSFLGDTEKALQAFNIKKMKSLVLNGESGLIYLNTLKYDPFLGNLRKEPSFQDFIETFENFYNKSHVRFMKWLDEQGKL